VLFTDIPVVYANYGTAQARAIRRINPSLLREFEFAARSMRPKIEAAAWFASETSRPAHIGSLSEAQAMIRGHAGTEIATAVREIEWAE
jgi:carbamate kinase